MIYEAQLYLSFEEEKEHKEQSFFEIQKRFKNGDKKALNELYTKLYTHALKIINSQSKKNSFIARMTLDEKKQKAHDASSYVIEQYLLRPDFEIKTNMPAYLFLRIRWELFGANYQAKKRKMLVFTDDIQEEAKKKIKPVFIAKYENGDIERFEYVEELKGKFKTLRKKNLIESIKTGKKWNGVLFDVIEVDE